MEEPASDEVCHRADLAWYLGRRVEHDDAPPDARGAQQFRFFPMSNPGEWDDGYAVNDPARCAPEVEGAFGHLMLQDLLALPVLSESERQRLLDGLGRAMEARDVWATVCLWDKIATDALQVSLVSNDKWDIYACDAKWPPVSLSLVTFLTLRVRRPRLLLAVVEPRVTYTRSGATITHADQKTTSLGALRKAVPALLAAVLTEFYLLSRHGASYDDDVVRNEQRWLDLAEAEDRGAPTGTWSRSWARVVGLLCRLLPNSASNPTLTMVQFGYLDQWHETRFTVSLLDVAVLCSERQVDPAIQLLNSVAWPRKALLSAFECALRPGGLRGCTMSQLALALYAKMIDPLRVESPNQPEDELSHALGCAWRAVYRAASWWAPIEVHGLSAQTVRLPVESGRDAHSPNVYEHLARALFDSHALLPARQGVDDWSVRSRWKALEETLWLALTPCRMVEPVCKPSLVRLLVQFLHEHNLLRDTVLRERAHSSPHACCSILDAAARLPPTDYAFLLGLLNAEELERDDWSACFAALVEMLTKHTQPSRDNLELLFELLEKQPDKLRAALAGTSTLVGGALGCYIRRFCFPNPGTQTVAYMADLPMEARSLAAAKTKQHLERFLNAGQWTAAHLRVALESASAVMSATAVQVLVSPPWNTPVPDGDAFVRAIFDAVYAPGEPVMQLASQGWGKRQRDE